MCAFRFKNSGSRPASGYSQRISQDDWAKHEDLIRRLHDSSVSRDNILETLANDHGFHPSPAQLALQAKKWGLFVYKCRQPKTGEPALKESPEASLMSEWGTSYPFLEIFFRKEMQPLNMFQLEIFVDILFAARLFDAAFDLYKVLFLWSLQTIHDWEPMKTNLMTRCLHNCFRAAASDAQRLEAVAYVDLVADLHPRASHLVKDLADLGKKRQLLPNVHDRPRAVRSEYATDLGGCDVVLKQVDTSHFTPCLVWCISCLEDLENADSQLTHCDMTNLTFDGAIISAAPGLLHSYMFWHFFRTAISKDSLPFDLSLTVSGSSVKVALPQILSIAAAVLIPRLPKFTKPKISPRGSDSWAIRLLEDEELLNRALIGALEQYMDPMSDCASRPSQADGSRMTENFVTTTAFGQVMLGEAGPTTLSTSSDLRLTNRLECLEYLKAKRDSSKIGLSHNKQLRPTGRNLASTMIDSAYRSSMPLIVEAEEDGRGAMFYANASHETPTLTVNHMVEPNATPTLALAPSRNPSNSSSFRSFLAVAARANAKRSNSRTSSDRISISSHRSKHLSWDFGSLTDGSRPYSMAMSVD